MQRNVFGLIFAGEENINLRELVHLRSVGALPIGGRYRVIDFLLSNMVNGGIRNVGVIPRKNYQSLMDHLGSGKEWDLSRKNDGLFILPPYDTYENTGSYKGMIDAIKGATAYIRRASQDYCLLSGSHTIFNRPFDEMFAAHMESGADITIMYYEEKVPTAESERFADVRLTSDWNGRISDIQFNSKLSTNSKVGMDVYLIKKDLLEYLVDEAITRGKYNFVKDIVMDNLKRLKVMGYEHKGYVARITSISSYFKTNMDFLKYNVQQELFLTENNIYTKVKDESPAKYGKDANVKNSLVASGCIIEGEVENSVLFRGVYVAKGAKIKNSIIMQDSEIYENTQLTNVILDKRVNVRQNATLMGSRDYPVIIPKGATV